MTTSPRQVCLMSTATLLVAEALRLQPLTVTALVTAAPRSGSPPLLSGWA